VPHRHIDSQHVRRSLRTAVVWSVLREALSSRSAATGRQSLDVVDAGGGTGGFAVPLAELGHRVTVVDPSPDALAALERRAAEAGVTSRVQGIQGDASGLLEVVAPDTADVLLCHGVLEYVDDPATALTVLARALRQDGILSVLAANRHAVVLARALAGRVVEARHALGDPAGRWGETDPVPQRFSAEDLVALLTTAHLTVTHVHGARVFSDLVPGALVDVDPGALDALQALEEAAADHPALRQIATQLHVLAVHG
jgi:SAM-dependent methyltransferase